MTSPSTAPSAVSFDHLAALTDEVGLFEHAELTRPRPEHGYCVDDVARGLLVVAREPDPSPAVLALGRTYLTFLTGAQDHRGRFHNRRATGGTWTDLPGLGDWWGRALWGLGTAFARTPSYAAAALPLFTRGADHRAPWSRPMAFAGLGAAEVLAVEPTHRSARALLTSAASFVAPATAGAGTTGTGIAGWPWPEPRLRYANAALPEVLLAAGSLLDIPQAHRWTEQGLTLLTWLVEQQTLGDHLSVVPTGGWASGEPRPGFDQQPIEVAALADAGARALEVTGDPVWRDLVVRCAAWFAGANDVGADLRDPVTGGGHDGLEVGGRNENEGAESTIALISTLQQEQRLATLSPSSPHPISSA